MVLRRTGVEALYGNGGFLYFTTQFLQGVLGYSALQAGIAFLPMTIPRLTPRFGNAAVLATGLAVTLVGMAWLSRMGVDSSYLTAAVLPMVLVGAGQGLAFAPLTSAGIAGVTAREAGAASGLVNTAHQLGSALGLGILVALSASSGAGAPDPATALAGHTSTAITGGSVLLAIALVLALVLIVPSEFTTRRASRRAAASPHDAVDDRELDVREEPKQPALT